MLPALDSVRYPGLLCDDCLIKNEYYPFHLALGDDDGEGLPEQFTLKSAWTPGNDLPSFPNEILYSCDVSEPNSAPGNGQGSSDLHEDRAVVQDLGEVLYGLKVRLERAIRNATLCLDTVERDIQGKEGLKAFAANPLTILQKIRCADRYVREVSRLEENVALCFKLIMHSLGVVLTYLKRMPGQGESLTSPDGLYTVSREQLDLGNCEVKDVLNSCGGPLKQFRRLQERLRQARDILKVPKMLRQKQAQAPPNCLHT